MDRLTLFKMRCPYNKSYTRNPWMLVQLKICCIFSCSLLLWALEPILKKKSFASSGSILFINRSIKNTSIQFHRNIPSLKNLSLANLYFFVLLIIPRRINSPRLLHCQLLMFWQTSYLSKNLRNRNFWPQKFTQKKRKSRQKRIRNKIA